MYDYWLKKTQTPLFPDIAWNKPERRDQAGRLVIIGGTVNGFSTVAHAYKLAGELGAGQVRAVMPDALKKTIPRTITEVVLIKSTISGGIDHDPALLAAQQWADVTLLIGDNGRSSETSAALETLTRQSGRLVITRDAVDVIKFSHHELVNRPETLLVMSFAQLQKLFSSVYYPIILRFSMTLIALVEAVHKFTLTYPLTIVTYHHEQLIIASSGRVYSGSLNSPLAIWRGDVATHIACYWLWNPDKAFEASVTAVETMGNVPSTIT